MRAVEIRVTGEVQGVGFRYHAAAEATRLSVVGWVRNEADGSVAVHAEGEPLAVAALVSWLHGGPPHARVDAVSVVDVESSGAGSFAITG